MDGNVCILQESIRETVPILIRLLSLEYIRNALFVLYVMNITACIGVLVEMDKGIKHPRGMVHPNHQVYQNPSITKY